MTIEIINKSIEAENIKEVKIKAGKFEIIASKESTDWNSDGINSFLINLGINTPENEKIEVNFNEEDNDSMYKYIVELFSEFANEYNNSISLENQQN